MDYIYPPEAKFDETTPMTAVHVKTTPMTATHVNDIEVGIPGPLTDPDQPSAFNMEEDIYSSFCGVFF
jgi:hypothetical protein